MYEAAYRRPTWLKDIISNQRKILRKRIISNEQSMEKYLVSKFEQYNLKHMNRVHKGFEKVRYDEWF